MPAKLTITAEDWRFIAAERADAHGSKKGLNSWKEKCQHFLPSALLRSPATAELGRQAQAFTHMIT